MSDIDLSIAISKASRPNVSQHTIERDDGNGQQDRDDCPPYQAKFLEHRHLPQLNHIGLNNPSPP